MGTQKNLVAVVHMFDCIMKNKQTNKGSQKHTQIFLRNFYIEYKNNKGSQKGQTKMLIFNFYYF
jgi:hypothetical protein